MSEPFIGQIICVGFNFAPLGWLYCNGQLVSIAQYDALYTLLGTTYGGDGVNTFGVPDLRGCAPVHVGQGPGLPYYSLGQAAGSGSVSLTGSTTPTHQHTVRAVAQPGTSSIPSASLYLSDEGPSGVPVTAYQPYDPAAQVALVGSAVSPAGSGLPHENRQPFQALTFAISTVGLYPPRN